VLIPRLLPAPPPPQPPGSSGGDKAQSIAQSLRDAGVAIRDVVSYPELAHIISTARTVYVPDNVFGGGERAVLEVR
jgi:hypothetical protein